MSRAPTDRDIIQAIGVPTLIEHGYTEHVVRKWVQRVIPWHARGKVERIARDLGVRIPDDFDVRQRKSAS